MSRSDQTNTTLGNAVDLSLIVPIYNEEGSLERLVEEIDTVMKNLSMTFELLLIDDGSTDASPRLLDRLVTDVPYIRVLRFAENRGQSAALAAGFVGAQAPVVVTMDADLQNDPNDIPRVLAALQGCDLVSGIRRGRQDTWSRRVASRIANRFRGWVLDDTVSDVGCSLKAYRRQFLTSLPVFDGMHRFLPALVKVQGGRIREIDVNHRPRMFDQSKYTIGGRFARGIRDLLGVHWFVARFVATDFSEVEAGSNSRVSGSEPIVR